MDPRFRERVCTSDDSGYSVAEESIRLGLLNLYRNLWLRNGKSINTCFRTFSK
jgi:hypothetical protein